jgi:hypothetical protein
MASFAWLQIYRSYTGDQLNAEIAMLTKQITDANGITSAGSGSKTYARDLAHLEGRLAAACQIQIEKGQSGCPKMRGGWGVGNFTNFRG